MSETELKMQDDEQVQNARVRFRSYRRASSSTPPMNAPRFRQRISGAMRDDPGPEDLDAHTD
jgi:hypothetical protein